MELSQGRPRARGSLVTQVRLMFPALVARTQVAVAVVSSRSCPVLCGQGSVIFL
jgi:proline racemase